MARRAIILTDPTAFRDLDDATELVRRGNALDRQVLLVFARPGGKLTAIHEELDALRRELAERGARLDGYYVCTHAPEVGCPCRWPADGLLRRARDEMGLDPGASWIVTDDPQIERAAAAAGFGVRSPAVRERV